MTAYGPLFHSESQLNGMLHEIEQELAQRGYQLVQDNLAGSLRHPTGHYQSRIRVSHEYPGAIVHDSNVVYSSWLEGTSERNQTTSFKGYYSFRRAAQQLDREAVRIAMPIVERFVRALT